MVDLTEATSSASLNPLQVTIHYVFNESGIEVDHMISFIAVNQEQFNQYNQYLLPGSESV